MRLVAFGQKFDVVSESHWFSYDYFIFDGVIALNAWRYIYALGSISSSRETDNDIPLHIVHDFVQGSGYFLSRVETDAGYVRALSISKR